MNRKLWLCGLTLMTTYLSGTSLLADGKWIVLFDGTSKDAWRGYQRKDFPDKGWVVDQGAFKTIVGGEHVDLVTKEKFRNFELELEWKVSPGGNGGIFYRASEADKEIWHAAPEIQVLDDDRHRDGKNPKDICGIALRPDRPRWQDSCDRWESSISSASFCAETTGSTG